MKLIIVGLIIWAFTVSPVVGMLALIFFVLTGDL